jgi:ubiquitin carboxyl-terminal hydrolase 34
MLLIKSILDITETQGIGTLKSHSCIIPGEELTIQAMNDITLGINIPQKATIKVNSNDTVLQLRMEIGKEFKCNWEEVKIVRGVNESQAIPDGDNGRSIGDLRFKNGETINCDRKPTKPINKAKLLTEANQLNPLLIKIFKSWFERFSLEGKMTAGNVASFIDSCT